MLSTSLVAPNSYEIDNVAVKYNFYVLKLYIRISFNIFLNFYFFWFVGCCLFGDCETLGASTFYMICHISSLPAGFYETSSKKLGFYVLLTNIFSKLCFCISELLALLLASLTHSFSLHLIYSLLYFGIIEWCQHELQTI